MSKSKEHDADCIDHAMAVNAKTAASLEVPAPATDEFDEEAECKPIPKVAMSRVGYPVGE